MENGTQSIAASSLDAAENGVNSAIAAVKDTVKKLKGLIAPVIVEHPTDEGKAASNTPQAPRCRVVKSMQGFEEELLNMNKELQQLVNSIDI